MNIELLLVALVPIVLFVVVEMRYGQKAGVYTAMVTGVLLALYLYLRYDDIDPMYLAELALIFVLGFASLKMKSSKYFKFQPLIVGLIFSTYIFGFQIVGDPYLVRTIPLMAKMEPKVGEMFSTPEAKEFLAMLSWQSGALILLHAIACGVAAWRFSSMGWLAVRVAIYPVLLVWFALASALFFKPPA
jgi:intracellular septation protein A